MPDLPETSTVPPPPADTGSRAAPGPWWRRPWALSLWTVLLLLGAAMAWPLWLAWQGPGSGVGTGPGPDARALAPDDLPWQVRPAGGGSQVFGLRLGAGTLADAQARFGDRLRVGLMQPQGEAVPALEGYVESLQAGFVTGRLVLAFERPAAWRQAALARSTRSEVGEGGRSRWHGLAPDDLPEARQAALVGLSFLPSAQLDEATLVQRFGPPAERLLGPAGEVQLLYPALGVAIALPPADAARARAVIQYVAPSAFEDRLRGPLRAASGAVGQPP